MKRRIVKKKENRRIKDLVKHQRKQKQLENITFDAAEGFKNYRYLWANNRRSTYGIPKKNLKALYKNIAKISILLVQNAEAWE